MSIDINQIADLLEIEQLPYTKINSKEYYSKSKHSSLIKVQIPSYFRKKINCSTITGIPVSSPDQNSFWHCLLYILCPNRYQIASWEQKKIYVEKFIQEIDYKIHIRFDHKNIIMRNTNYQPNDLRYRVKYITDDVIFGVVQCLNINIVVVTHENICYHFPDCQYNINLPLIILNRDYQQCYSVISVDDLNLFTKDSQTSLLISYDSPVHNNYILSILKNRKIKNEEDQIFYSKAQGLSIKELKIDIIRKKLLKLKLCDLKIRAKDYELDLDEIEGRLTKSKIVDMILANSSYEE
jgi:hypothetical protein